MEQHDPKSTLPSQN